jgi:hypothetical protein
VRKEFGEDLTPEEFERYAKFISERDQVWYAGMLCGRTQRKQQQQQ